MENISHTVAGLAAGELIHRSLAGEVNVENQSLRRKLLLVTCAVAGNFPDLDLVFTNLLPKPLGYLLHHRGHTHTLLYAVPQALLLAILIWVLWPKARNLLRGSSTARRGFAFALTVGFGLHFLMDYLNSYGVHLFHPFDSRWIYGDMVYIVEPFFWFVFASPLLVTLKRRSIRNLLTFAMVSLQFLFWWRGFLPMGSLVLLFALGGILAILEKRGPTRSRRALTLAFAAAFSFVGVQYYASTEAKRLVRAGLAARDAGATLLDVAGSSSPTNPFCWGFVAVEKNEQLGTYRLTRGRLSLRPSIYSVSDCSNSLLAANKDESEIAPGLIIASAETGDLNLLRKTVKENCNLLSWFRFARAPYLTTAYAVDVRFSMAGGAGNFSYFDVDDFDAEECAGPIPQWGFPRADLIAKPGENSDLLR